MRLSMKLVDALAKGWRNIDAYSIFSDEGKRAHATATMAALKKAGFEIVKRKDAK